MKDLKEYINETFKYDNDLFYIVQDKQDKPHTFTRFDLAKKLSEETEHPIYMIERRDKKNLIQLLNNRDWKRAEELSQKCKDKYADSKENSFGNDFY